MMYILFILFQVLLCVVLQLPVLVEVEVVHQVPGHNVPPAGEMVEKRSDEKDETEGDREGDVADLPELEAVESAAPEMELVEAVVPVAAGGIEAFSRSSS